MWTGLGDDGGGGDGEPGGGVHGVTQWMSLMADHMAQESSRVPFLWPGHLNNKLSPLHNTQGEFWETVARHYRQLSLDHNCHCGQSSLLKIVIDHNWVSTGIVDNYYWAMAIFVDNCH